MDRKQLCVANVRYKKPTAQEGKRMGNLLKYLTYREGRDEKARRQVSGEERWTDRGMGGSVAEIAHQCEGYRSNHVLLFTLVLNPHPNLIEMIQPQERENFVRELTEGTMEDYFEARGLDGGVEWSYCLHHRQTDDPQAPGLHNPHSHLILPGTYYDDEYGARMPLYFNRNKRENHIELLHATTEANMVNLLQAYVGPDWEARFDRLEALREAQSVMTGQREPHGFWEETPIWSGARATDERTSAVGVYGYFPDDLETPDLRSLRFRAFLKGLPHEEADRMAAYLAGFLSRDMARWEAELARIGGMSAEERALLYRSDSDIAVKLEPKLDLDL